MTSDPHGPYLLVLGEGSTRLIPLDGATTSIIGSAESAGIRIEDGSLEPAHALLDTSESGVFVTPIAGETLLNEEPIRERRSVRPGDTLRLGSVAIGLHGHCVRSKERALLTAVQMRQRLVEESERFLRYRRPFAFMLVRARPAGPEEEAAMLQAVSRAVRVVDVVAWDGHKEIWVLFPETEGTAMIPAQRVQSGVAQVVRDAAGALARCPIDGIDPDALLAGTRAAARQAAPGTVVSIADAGHTLHVGGKSIVAADPLMRSLFELVRRIAGSEIPVLIAGETGSGKEIVAQAVHAWSKRCDARMVSVNCAAMSETLLESELFGHEKGAFTGAVAVKPGLFEEANGGTVFLDEVGECSPRTQAELLRVLETKRYCRVGSLKERTANVRIVAATNRSLEDEIRAGRFRQDLYFRLNAAMVTVPPLRDRPLDLPVLTRAFLSDGCRREGREPFHLSSEAMARLALHDWPGNVRELRNTLDFVSATAQGDTVEARDLPATVAAKAAPWLLDSKQASPPRPSRPAVGGPPRKKFRNLYEEVRELEMQRIQEALEETGGVRNLAADLIGVPLRTLVTKIKVYGLGPAPPRARRKPS
jgi:DNA-binding NtrC family response regulator